MPFACRSQKKCRKNVPFGGCSGLGCRLSWRRGWAVPCALIGFSPGPPRYRPRQVSHRIRRGLRFAPRKRYAVRPRRRGSAPRYDGPITGTDAPGQHGTVSCFLFGRLPYYLPRRPSLWAGPAPYASADRKRRSESRPPFVCAQEATIPRDMDISSPTVLALSDRLDATFVPS